MRAVIPAGSCSRDIALRGRGGRYIASFAFTYEARAQVACAYVRLFAR